MLTPSIIRILGYLGLIPFVVPAILLSTNAGYTDLAILIGEAYAFGIICFLTGSWWGMGSKADSRSLILLSNVYFLITFLAWLFAPSFWSPTAAALLIGIFLVEQRKSLFPDLADYYHRMRALLTLIAASSMLVIHFAR